MIELLKVFANLVVRA